MSTWIVVTISMFFIILLFFCFQANDQFVKFKGNLTKTFFFIDFIILHQISLQKIIHVTGCLLEYHRFFFSLGSKCIDIRFKIELHIKETETIIIIWRNKRKYIHQKKMWFIFYYFQQTFFPFTKYSKDFFEGLFTTTFYVQSEQL